MDLRVVQNRHWMSGWRTQCPLWLQRQRLQTSDIARILCLSRTLACRKGATMENRRGTHNTHSRRQLLLRLRLAWILSLFLALSCCKSAWCSWSELAFPCPEGFWAALNQIQWWQTSTPLHMRLWTCPISPWICYHWLVCNQLCWHLLQHIHSQADLSQAQATSRSK